MPKKYVSISKQSKRNQKKYHAKQRGDWGNVIPITRTKPSKKIYNRKKSKQAHQYKTEPFGFFNCSLLFV
ncbi:MAG: hypothetical protein FWE44_07105 [Defluviitaleaceae bacterium]|nr:hypothetical protein [Defluviitaleaceae bacterium]